MRWDEECAVVGNGSASGCCMESEFGFCPFERRYGGMIPGMKGKGRVIGEQIWQVDGKKCSPIHVPHFVGASVKVANQGFRAPAILR